VPEKKAGREQGRGEYVKIERKGKEK